MLRKRSLALFVFISHFSISFAQSDTSKTTFSIETRAGIGSTTQVPFWMRANKYGDVPPAGANGGINARFSRSYKRLQGDMQWNDSIGGLDWRINAEVTGYAARNSVMRIIEADAALRYRIFELKVGRSKEVVGLNGDTTLSSGNFAISGNALGIPKIDLSIPNYWKLPFFNGLIAIKGNFSHGWLGNMEILKQTGGGMNSNGQPHPIYLIQNTNPSTFIHQKSFYGRLGKENWRIKFYGGFSHHVQWGNEKEAYGDNFALSPLKSFTYVALGLAYGAEGIPISKIGNQIGSIDLGLDYRVSNVLINVYRQNFYDVGALYYLANIRDGLNGVSVKNLSFRSNKPGLQWKKFLIEFFYSMDQAGYPSSKATPSGDEDYYNNYYYKQGWSYKGEGLGTPLITPSQYAKLGQTNDPFDYFINNRIIALHTALDINIYDWQFIAKATISDNYGTFSTSKYGKSTGRAFAPPFGAGFIRVNQLSIGVETKRVFKNGWYTVFTGGFDKGKLLENSTGITAKLGRCF